MNLFKGTLLGACLLASLLAAGPTRLAHAQRATTEAAPTEQSAQSQPPVQKPVQAAENPARTGNSLGLTGPEQRVALVIGNSNYRNVAQLSNPSNDAKAVAQLLNAAGFEVISATDLNHNEMIQVVQDFSGKIAGRGPNTVAMVYYAGHGVQLAGENYLVPIDARISSEPDLVNGSVRLVDVMATLETIPSRMRIVILDACRNNPFPSLNEAGRGLAIVDAPNGSIVAYSTAPGTEALDGTGDHSPYAAAFLRLAHEKNLPIEQLFKRIRLDVNNSTDGRQTPWESSSLTRDFYFFGDTAVAATRVPAPQKAVRVADNLPSRATRQAYDYVLAENSAEYYQEFIRLYPHDPLCDRIRALLGSLVQAKAWHNAVLANSPVAYKSFYDKFSNGPYAQSALKLAAQPKMVPLSQPTQIIAPASIKLGGLGMSRDNSGLNPGASGLLQGRSPQQGNVLQGGLGNIAAGKSGMDKSGTGGRIVTLPSAGTNASSGSNSAASGKIVNLPTGGLNKTGGQNPKLDGVVNRIEARPAKPLPRIGVNRQPAGISRSNIGTPPGSGGSNLRMVSTQSHGSGLQPQQTNGRFGRW
ncbi:caspase family protein [Bradyrhizobium sediminis]|uniref:Caspase family protein n=1 Tax=Bradyrhizobium sediminis TaxID=2840469 RepID=A0A975P178_9BRAD|nr:caspase family protein [Bradyrhizobium sediminis]QWG24745.1 caspase family protein [Bradyrhizobium sediminis]